MLASTTPNGKGIELFYEGRIVRAKLKEGGVIPNELSGGWTGMALAQAAVNKYVGALEAKPEKYKTKLNKEDYKK